MELIKLDGIFKQWKSVNTRLSVDLDDLGMPLGFCHAMIFSNVVRVPCLTIQLLVGEPFLYTGCSIVRIIFIDQLVLYYDIGLSYCTFAFQAMVLGVLAEHSMPFSHAPVVIDLAKKLAHDPKALSTLSMDRTSASYKMRFGLGKSMLEDTVEKIRHAKFSLNMDESTSENLKKVLEVLTSFYDDSQEAVVVEHLASVNVVKTNAESLYKEVCTLFETLNLPWENLM